MNNTGEEEPTKTLMVHPFTHEVYRIPERVIMHDRQCPMQMNYKTFEH